MSVLPIAPIASGAAPMLSVPSLNAAPGGFANMVRGGLADLGSKVAEADRLSRAFVLDDRVPVHQVTFALEQARLSLELAMQVRTRLVESYQSLMAMQL